MISSSSSSIDNLLHLLRIMRDNPGHTHIPLEVVIGTFIDTQMRSEMKTLGHKIQVGVKDRLLGNDEPLNLQQVRVLHLNLALIHSLLLESLPSEQAAFENPFEELFSSLSESLTYLEIYIRAKDENSFQLI